MVLALHFSAVPELEIKLIEAAAEAGVRWIVPTEFGSDNANEGISNVPINAAKVAPREKIEELGLSWIGVVTNPWLDYVSVLAILSACAKRSIPLIALTEPQEWTFQHRCKMAHRYALRRRKVPIQHDSHGNSRYGRRKAPWITWFDARFVP